MKKQNQSGREKRKREERRCWEEEKAARWEGLANRTDCQCGRKRVGEGTITQSELKIFDKSSENQLSSEIDVSRLVFEPTHAVPGMPKETSAPIINDTSVDWRQGEGT